MFNRKKAVAYEQGLDFRIAWQRGLRGIEKASYVLQGRQARLVTSDPEIIVMYDAVCVVKRMSCFKLF